jgi:RNA polymerase sigma-70 factor (ECF subfamily)
MNERELVAQAQSGDFEAFIKLVDAHKGKVYAMVRRLAGNEQDAEDIMQDTLLKAIDKIEQFRAEASFGTWLYSIALNQSRAQFSKSKQADLKPLEEYLPMKSAEGSHEEINLFDWQDPQRVLEIQELRGTLNTAVAELPYKYREAFLLRYIEELSVKEVARLTGQSEASAKSRILRARLALRDRLSGEFEEKYGQELS